VAEKVTPEVLEALQASNRELIAQRDSFYDSVTTPDGVYDHEDDRAEVARLDALIDANRKALAGAEAALTTSTLLYRIRAAMNLNHYGDLSRLPNSAAERQVWIHDAAAVLRALLAAEDEETGTIDVAPEPRCQECTGWITPPDKAGEFCPKHQAEQLLLRYRRDVHGTALAADDHGRKVADHYELKGATKPSWETADQ
jgi:hypothetical protein